MCTCSVKHAVSIFKERNKNIALNIASRAHFGVIFKENGYICKILRRATVKINELLIVIIREKTAFFIRGHHSLFVKPYYQKRERMPDPLISNFFLLDYELYLKRIVY